MLSAVKKELENFTFILASGSPRRKQLLEEHANLKIIVMPSKYEENLNPLEFECPGDFAIATSRGKAVEVADRVAQERATSLERVIIIAADTAVECDGKILGKPTDPDDAKATLRHLSGRCHAVHSGVTVGVFNKSLINGFDDYNSEKLSNSRSNFFTVEFKEKTLVKFCELTELIIDGYVATGEGSDKAGGYGIQALGSTLVEGIEGDYYNVVGLPLTHLCKFLFKIVDNK